MQGHDGQRQVNEDRVETSRALSCLSRDKVRRLQRRPRRSFAHHAFLSRFFAYGSGMKDSKINFRLPTALYKNREKLSGGGAKFFWNLFDIYKKSYLCCQILSTIFKDGIPFIVGLSKTSILCGNRGLKMRLHIL